MNRRVLVTGSRTWKWPVVIVDALAEQRARLPADAVLTVVVGYDPGSGYPPGADYIAHTWALHHHRAWPQPGQAAVDVETHPARWRECGPACDPGDAGHRRAADRAARRGRPRSCPTAGHRRNQQMVDSGIDLALGFCLDDSRGTLDCIDRVRAARIPHVLRSAYTKAA